MPQFRDQIEALRQTAAAGQAQLAGADEEGAARHVSPLSGAGEGIRNKIAQRAAQNIQGQQEAISQTEQEQLRQAAGQSGRALERSRQQARQTQDRVRGIQEQNVVRGLGRMGVQKRTEYNQRQQDLINKSIRGADIPGAIRDGFQAVRGPSGNILEGTQTYYPGETQPLSFTGMDLREQQDKYARLGEIYGPEYATELRRLDQEVQSAREMEAAKEASYLRGAQTEATDIDLASRRLGLSRATALYGSQPDIEAQFGPGASFDASGNLIQPARESARITGEDGRTLTRTEPARTLYPKERLDTLKAEARGKVNTPADIQTIQFYADKLFKGNLQKAAEYHHTAKDKSPLSRLGDYSKSAYLQAQKENDPAAFTRAEDSIRAFRGLLEREATPEDKLKGWQPKYGRQYGPPKYGTEAQPSRPTPQATSPKTTLPGLPEGTVDNGDGTFTLPSGSIVRSRQR